MLATSERSAVRSHIMLATSELSAVRSHIVLAPSELSAVACPPHIRSHLLQWKSDLIREVASLEGDNFISILLCQCVWNFTW